MSSQPFAIDGRRQNGESRGMSGALWSQGCNRGIPKDHLSGIAARIHGREVTIASGVNAGLSGRMLSRARGRHVQATETTCPIVVGIATTAI